MTEAITGRIYRIISDSHPEVLPYYGSTVLSLKKRWYNHKGHHHQCCSTLLMSFDYVRIELIEEFVCESITTLRQREQWYIDNNPCCNKYRVIGRDIESMKQKKKEWRESHKEELKEKDKKYRETNREERNKKKKEWYEANKERILQKAREKYHNH